MENFRVTKVNISTRYLPQQPLSVDFFLYINIGMCFCLLYLIKIFKMAAELYKGHNHAHSQATQIPRLIAKNHYCSVQLALRKKIFVYAMISICIITTQLRHYLSVQLA